MNYKDIYSAWIADPAIDKETKAELIALTDEKEIEDRFYQYLDFGTGGIRGIMGAGINRMNRYTVRTATKGLADVLHGKGRVAIAYDTRNDSRVFAEETAQVLCAQGIFVYLFADCMPTPVLSYAVRYLSCDAGVVITASHNPKQYNGYKVYNAQGGQMVPHEANAVAACIAKARNKKIDVIPLGEARRQQLLQDIDEDVLQSFLEAVMRQSLDVSQEDKESLSIVYTPLHGTGRVPVSRVLRQDQFTRVHMVEEQASPDGNFPTVISPNPEDKRALSLAISQAKNKNADIILGTDPDCDRVGVAVLHQGEYVSLTGNQIGALLVAEVLKQKKKEGLLSSKSTLIKTIVTSELGANIARDYGLHVMDTLTGFKYIGEKINEFEKTGSHDFVLGYEESYGYLVGDHARDKDAVVSSLLMCEIAAIHKAAGKTLVDALNALYRKYGYFYDDIVTFACEGKRGQEDIAASMEAFRRAGNAVFPQIARVEDYGEGINGLPKENLLRFMLESRSWIAVRPSGTEPKIKVYFSIRADGREDAESDFMQLRDIAHSYIIND